MRKGTKVWLRAEEERPRQRARVLEMRGPTITVRLEDGSLREITVDQLERRPSNRWPKETW